MTEKTIEHRLAWLAGILDGEGWISVGIEKLPGHRQWADRRYTAARWQIGVCNTDPAMLNEILSIASVLGVRCKYYDRADGPWRGNRKLQGRVAFESKGACEVLLKAVFPYLVTKRSRAELMLRAIARRQAFGHCRHAGWVPVVRDEAFLGIVSEMRDLNHRGKKEGE